VRNDDRTKFLAWVAALERRHLANLRIQEVTRALRALSSAYVERRGHGTGRHVHGALDSAGKRAAFALYYAPLHFIAVAEVVRSLGLDPPPAGIVDLGSGTGAAGAAWALAARAAPPLLCIDRHPWAVAETRWTLGQLGLRGRAQQGDVARPYATRSGTGVIAAYTLNELSDEDRSRVEDRLLAHADDGGHLLILEPLARGVAPWWPAAAARITGRGGRADQWRLPIEVPPVVERLGTAAGLTYGELRLQTLYLRSDRDTR
jgi:hypothetical protein